MQYKYAQKLEKPHSKAVGKDLSISTKQSVEICGWIRGKNVESVKKMLQNVINMKRPVPFKKFTGDIGHKRGMMAGRYPVKACEQVLSVVGSAEANAQAKGLSVSDCVVHVLAHKGGGVRRYGRQGSRFAKKTTIEVLLEETKKAKVPEKKKVKETKKEVPVQSQKPEVKVPEKKAEEQPKPEVKEENKPEEKK